MVTTRSNRVAAPLTIALALLAGCGGSGGGTATPTTPTPAAPTTPTSSACATLSPSLTGTSTHAIVNGADCSVSNDAVVLLNMKDSGGSQVASCSGTIIAPRAILTAAHCLQPPTTSVKVFLGTGDQITAQSFAFDPSYHEATDNTSFDVGVVLLSDDVGRTPIPLLLSRDAIVGETAVIAGWGKDANGNLATLRAGVAVVTAVSSLELQTVFTSTAASVCQGDSGGPILLQDGGVWSVGGVISANSTLACSSGANFYANVRNSNIMAFILGQVPNPNRR